MQHKSKSGHIHLGSDKPACTGHAGGPEVQLTAEIGLVDCLGCLALVQVVMEALVNGRATPQEIARVQDSAERAAQPPIPLTVDERVALKERWLRGLYAQWEAEGRFGPGLADKENWDEFRAKHRAEFENYERVEKRLGRELEDEEKDVLNAQLAKESSPWSGSDGYRRYVEVLKKMGEPVPKNAADEIARLEKHEAKLEVQRVARAALRGAAAEAEPKFAPFTIQMEPRKDDWQATVGNMIAKGTTPHEAVTQLFAKFAPAKKKK